jgi:hypothetical protein
MKKQINEIKKMQRLAGIITESEYQEAVMNDDQVDIISFLKNNKQDFLSRMTDKMSWDEDDIKKYTKADIKIGKNEEGKTDPDVALLGGTFAFSFSPLKVKRSDLNNFVLKNINGKNIYGTIEKYDLSKKDTDNAPRDKFGRLKYF